MSRMIQSTIKFSRNKSRDFLSNIDFNSCFIKPVDKMEIQNILSLNHLKAVGPNSIPTKILKFHSNGISNQSSELIHLSFSLSVFPSILKSSKVFQKESYLNVQIMVQYLYFLVLTNSLKMMYNSLYEFLEPKSLIYNLQSGFRQKH